MNSAMASARGLAVERNPRQQVADIMGQAKILHSLETNAEKVVIVDIQVYQLEEPVWSASQ